MKVVVTIHFGMFKEFFILNLRWILVQPENKGLKGRYIEKVGYWIPRKTKTV